MHGLLGFEVAQLVEWGARPVDALRAATNWAAECCRIEDEAGTLEPGKLADLISLAGNPLSDIRAIDEVRLVVKGGRRYDHLSRE
jgi:imidazolonepropionase-like amidohydrolase